MPCFSFSLPPLRRRRSACSRLTLFEPRRSTGFAAGHLTLIWMILPPHCTSKDMLRTASEVTYGAVTSSLIGSSNKDIRLPMPTQHSSNAISAGCRVDSLADCLKSQRGWPICSNSGICKSVCRHTAMKRLEPRSTNGSFAMTSTWSRSVAPPPVPAVTISASLGVF